MKILNITPDNAHLFKDIMKEKNVIIKFYSPTCPACLAMVNEWNKLEHKMKNKMNHIHLLNVRSDSLPHLQHDIIDSVEYFPKIIVNKLDKTGKYMEFKGARDVDTMSKWIDSMFNTKKKRKSHKSHKGGKKTKKRGKKRKSHKSHKGGKKTKKRGGKWSLKYKRSINCRKPKGFSQKQYCNNK